jgi:dTDP-4-dehydrorhamnose reductase
VEIDTKVLVVGRGHLGRVIAKELGVPEEMHWVDEMDLLTDSRLAELQPDVVVNCAGKTDLAWCEGNPGETFRGNVSSPVLLSRRVFPSLFVHMSSGCIWDGPYDKKGNPFQNDHMPTPAAFYSWTKAACDAMMLQEKPKGWDSLVILRPRQVYSDAPSPRNTFSKLSKYPKLIDTPNSMTSAYTIVKVVQGIVSEFGQFGFLQGFPTVMNVYDRGVTSPWKIGNILADEGLREPPEKMTKDDLDQWLIPRRVDAVLEDTFFEERFDPPDVEEEARRLARLMREKEENVKA